MNTSERFLTTYDYVIIGAGSAGGTLAARLSENPSSSVLLLEAGPDYRSKDTHKMIETALIGEMLQNEEFRDTYFWSKLNARRTSAQEPKPYLRGRGMGGTSTISTNTAMRGMLEDFDIWEELGCTGWSGKNVLPDFIRMEDDLDYGHKSYHGRGGPIPIHREPIEQWGSVSLALREAGLDLGYGWSDDYNAPGSTGVSPIATNTRNGVRISTNDYYLEQARSRANLTIIGDALVDHVLFNDRRAVGARVHIDGTWEQVKGKEIVLCAGAIHSPAILMRSGIGPADNLQAHGIDPILDAVGVGQNLRDHPSIWLLLSLRSEAQIIPEFGRYHNCCIRYSSGLAGAGKNDMLISASNMRGYDEKGASRGSLLVSVYQSFSQGRISLTSPDPEVNPQIDEMLLSDERDHIRLRDGLQRLFEIARHPALTKVSEGGYIGKSQQNIDDFSMGDTLDEWLLKECADGAHAIGTCRMGPIDDPQSVVDPDGRVIGVEGLRIVDASIMPEIPRANVHLSIVMIAEHIAERIIRAGT